MEWFMKATRSGSWFLKRKLPTFLCGVVVTIIIFKLQTIPNTSNRECINWSEIPADSMTGRQILDYLKWTNQTSCEILSFFGGIVQQQRRFSVAGIDGQKALCVDLQVEPEVNCLVYSFGINNEWSFDEAMEKYGCHIFAFDPSMRADDHMHSKRIHFYNLGLGAEDFIRNDSWKLKTLSSIYNMLEPLDGDRIIDYLKIDIEGDEWSVIPNIIDSGMLPKIRQMGIEVHLLPVTENIGYYRKLVKTLQLLEANGMVRFSSLANPASYAYINAFDFTDHTCHEIAWYNLNHYQTAEEIHKKI